jgi:prephenate dehydrogenase
VPRLFDRVTIAGVGLIGGSLALAARAAGLIGEVIGLGRGAANLELARQRGIIDRYSHDPHDAARDADLLLLAVPVATMPVVARAAAPALRAGAVVSDAGSVKTAVLRDMEAVLPPGVPFVGAHPIAGTEESGAGAARADLFRGCRCILTPGPGSDATAVAKIRALWEGVGMHVVEMDAMRHDQILAWVSHLPHVLAFSAVHAVVAADPALREFAGPSFRDLTRVAASPVDMWRDILMANADQVDAVLDRFLAALDTLRQHIARRDVDHLEAFLGDARAARLAWNGPRK